MADRKSLRLSATLLFVGLLLTFLVGIFHPDTQNPNNHIAEFTLYANSDVWTAVHLGQFVGMAVVIAGLLVLFFALDVRIWGARVDEPVRRRVGSCSARPIWRPSSSGRGRPQAGCGCMGKGAGGREGSTIRERRSDSMA